MSGVSLSPGDVVWADLPALDPQYREQEGRRPAVIVAVTPPSARFPLLLIVPFTSQNGPWRERCPELYPLLPSGAFAVPGDSVAMIDQLRAIDRRRLGRYLGTLAPNLYAPIVAGIQRLLGK